jgi:hypothetical protein
MKDKKTRALEDKREGATTNPYGANQYLYDPRQKLCWDLYINPKSETFGNAKASAKKAGYTELSADIITVEPWFQGKLRDLNLLEKGKMKLDEIMNYVAMNEEGKVDTGVLRIQADVSKFLTERLGKNDGFALRTELTGADGVDLGVVMLPPKE